MFFCARLNYANVPETRGQPRIGETAHDFRLSSADGSVDITLARRNVYPQTYCQQTDSDTYELGYGPRHPKSDDEFLHITIHSSGRLCIVRDVYATLPLFYGMGEGFVIVSNSYEFIAASLPHLSLNERGIADVLVPHVALHPVLWKEIGSLGEREILEVTSEGKVHVTHPSSRPWATSSDVPPSDPAEFISRLEQALNTTLQRYTTPNDVLAFELSGGLDSPLLPLYLSRKQPDRPWYSITVLTPGRPQTTLSAKLAAIQKIAPAAQLHVLRPKEHHLPLATILSSPQAYQFYPDRDVYYEQQESAGDAFQAYNAAVVFTGMGGDDLFEHIVKSNTYIGVGEEGILERMDHFASFYTEALRSLVRVTTPKDSSHRPTPLLSVSLAAPSMHHNVYIERGLWPASPYLNVDFYNYCQGLPWNLKKGKRLLRAYYQANRFPRYLYDKTFPNEDFNNYFDEALLSPFYARFIEYFAQEGVTVAMGYVDGQKLLESYRKTLSSGKSERNELFQIYLWLCVEVNLHTALRSGQWRPK